LALRQLTKLRDVPVEIQQAFQSAWIETKTIPLKARNHSILCAALRVMFPPYTGPGVRLFQGAASTNIGGGNTAYRGSHRGRTVCPRLFKYVRRVVLETVAPAAAIISKIEYPQPWTDSEREEILREHPNTNFNEYHDEREFLINRRRLRTVTVQRLTGASTSDDSSLTKHIGTKAATTS
jgi:hypothetical protein